MLMMFLKMKWKSGIAVEEMIGFLSDLHNIRVYSIKCNYNSKGYYMKFCNLHIFGSYSSNAIIGLSNHIVSETN